MYRESIVGRGRLPLLALLSALGVIAGCGPAPAPPEPPDELSPVPEPDLSGVEPKVRERILQTRARLDAAVASGAAPADLATTFGATGMLYHAYQLTSPAEACYENAQSLAPGDPRWPYYLALVLRPQARIEDAIAAFERSLELEPGHVPTWVHLANLERESNRLEQAEAHFRRALELDADSVAARIGLGKIASTRGDFAAAVESFEQALRLAPQATEIHYPLGLAYRGLGRSELAQRHFDLRGNVGTALTDPWMAEVEALREGWRLHQTRGSKLFSEKLFAEALVEYRQALEAAPEEPGIRVNIGSTLSMLGDLPGAIAEFREALRLQPGHALAHFNLGTLSARSGDDAEAIAHYRAALQSTPDHLDTRFNLGNALRRVGRFDDAAAEYRRVIEADPRHATARLAEALSLVRLRRFDDAVVRLDEALAALPEDANLRLAMARLLAAAPSDRLRNGSRALALAQTLVAENSSVHHVATLAMAAAEVGDFATAVRLQEQAVSAVRSSARGDLLPELEQNLARYRRGEPCRAPWREDDPALNPKSAPRPPHSNSPTRRLPR